MAEEDAEVGGAEGTRRLYVFRAPEHQHLPAHQARHPGPADDPDQHEGERQVGAHRGGDGDEEEERREGERHVGQPHDERVHPTPIVPGDEAEGDAEGEGHGLRDDADEHRDPGTIEDPAQDVTPLTVGPEEVRPARREEIGPPQVAGEGVEGRDPRGQQRGQQDDGH